MYVPTYLSAHLHDTKLTKDHTYIHAFRNCFFVDVIVVVVFCCCFGGGIDFSGHNVSRGLSRVDSGCVPCRLGSV
jgi:hypothetical protein